RVGAPAAQPVVGPPPHQRGLGAQRLVEGELVELWAILDQADPAAAAEAFITGRVLDDAVERNVGAPGDPSPFGSPFVGVVSYQRRRPRRPSSGTTEVLSSGGGGVVWTIGATAPGSEPAWGGPASGW